MTAQHPDRIHGRGGELALIKDLCNETPNSGGALVFYGDAGLGKSTLLDAAETMACGADVEVLRSTGAEFEADISYAGLNQLLLPVRGQLAEPAPVPSTLL